MIDTKYLGQAKQETSRQDSNELLELLGRDIPDHLICHRCKSYTPKKQIDSSLPRKFLGALSGYIVAHSVNDGLV